MLKIELGDRSYDIVIGPGLIHDIGGHIAEILSVARVFVVTDKNVAKHYLADVEQSLQKHDIAFSSHILEPGEQTKQFSSLQTLVEDILSHKPERNVTLIALGGGVIGDLTGFTASILLRGVQFIQVPTTLLAQVDSSVGGKTGINSQYGKNLIGSFYQPKKVLADCNVLASLDDRQYWAGYAEVIKYGLIQDAQFYQWLKDNHHLIASRDLGAMTHMVKESCACKADIVSRDEREQGVRALLNFGHTFGHAMEACSGYSDVLFHGEAVAAGMVMAATLSAGMGLCDATVAQDLAQYLTSCNLPATLKDVDYPWNVDELVKAMAGDKKVSHGKIAFIVLNAIGDAHVSREVDMQLVSTVLRLSQQGKVTL